MIHKVKYVGNVYVKHFFCFKYMHSNIIIFIASDIRDFREIYSLNKYFIETY